MSQEQDNGSVPSENPTATAAQCFLRNSSYAGLHNIKCQYHNGVLILTGKVSSYYLKQIAQTTVRNVEHAAQVDNRIEVT